MSPFVGDDEPLSEQEFKCAYIGIPLGALLFAAILYLLAHVASLPASQEDRAQFHKLVGISLSAEQTLSSFHTKDPVTHALQQKAVDGFLWGRVAEAYQEGQLLAKLQERRSSLEQANITDDASISRTKSAIADMDTQISMAEKAQEKTRDSWSEIQGLIRRCRFGDAGTYDLDYAIYSYGLSLKQQPPQKVGAAEFLSTNFYCVKILKCLSRNFFRSNEACLPSRILARWMPPIKCGEIT